MSGRVLVTGGSSGIGASVVRSLRTAGYSVDFTFLRSSGAARELAGPGVEAIECDLADRGRAEALAEQVSERDYYAFVHSAGISADALGAAVDLRAAQRAMDVNFWSFVALYRAVIRGMTRNRGGRVVVLSSIAAHVGSQGSAAYAATKGALEAYVRCLVEETARKGVTVNCVAPGFVDTPMLAPYEARRARTEARIPARRLGDPDEVAAAVMYLLSPGAAYVTGATLVVDGGLSCTVGASS